MGGVMRDRPMELLGCAFPGRQLIRAVGGADKVGLHTPD